MARTDKFIVKTFSGLENVLAKELRGIGAENIQPSRRSVSFSGTKEMMYRANMQLRTALSILKPIYTFQARSEIEFYKAVRSVRWKDYIDVNQTFAVESVVFSEYFSHSQYISLKTKDAIVDYFRGETGKRPSVDPKNPHLKVTVHISENNCTLSLNSSGQPLFKRGYRLDSHVAPLNETLAAGMVLLSGWKGDCQLIDPMCGSGTILTEAAMIAQKIPPGAFRKDFGFRFWRDFDSQLWRKIKTEANNQIINLDERMILGADISPDAITISNNNIENAGLEDNIRLKISAFEDLSPPEEKGIIIMNPPYDERIKQDDIMDLYSKIGSELKHKYEGFSAWILSSNSEAINQIGLKSSEKIPLFNGPLECKYLRYDLFKGTMKQKKMRGVVK